MTSPQVVKVDNLDGFIKWLRTAEARPIEHLRALGADDGYIERARRGKAGLVPGVTTSFTDASGKRRVIVPSQKNIAAGQVLFMVQTILDELAEPEIVRDKPWQMPLWTISMEHARLTFFNEELAREFRNDHNRKIGARNSGRRSPVTEVLQAILRNDPTASAACVASILNDGNLINGIDVESDEDEFRFRCPVSDRVTTLSRASLANALSRLRNKKTNKATN